MVPNFQFGKDFILEDRGNSVIILACDIGVHCVDELCEKKILSSGTRKFSIAHSQPCFYKVKY
jgi:hypothetical protein